MSTVGAAALRAAAKDLRVEMSRPYAKSLMPVCHKRQCKCNHPTYESYFDEIVEAVRDALIRRAIEMEADDA